MRALDIRRLLGSMGLVAAVLCTGISLNPQPVRAQGDPPIIRFFGAWAERTPTFSEPHLFLNLQIDDPDGQVPLTIQSVTVNKPDGSTVDLTANYRYPNLSFRGDYFLDSGQPVAGLYTVVVTDAQGHTVTGTDMLNPFPSLLAPAITAPDNEEIVTTTTPTIRWTPVADAASTRVAIRSADMANGFGDSIYTGPVLAGGAGEFTLPGGVLTPGRRYLVEVQALDTSAGTLPGASMRGLTRRPFSVAGPSVGLSLNQGTFAAGQTLRLGVAVRNDGPPVSAVAQLWAGLPDGSVVEVMDLDVETPSTAPDVSTVTNDILTYAFGNVEPAGAYVLGIRLKEKDSGAVIAQSLVSFTFAP